MFNFIGKVTGIRSATAAAIKGYKVYNVMIPAISPEDIECGIITLPGVCIDYNIGDVVIVAELEGDDLSYFILGRLQKGDVGLELSGHRMRAISAEELKVRDRGSIAANVMLERKQDDKSEVVSLSVWDILKKLDYLENELQKVKDSVDTLLPLLEWRKSFPV